MSKWSEIRNTHSDDEYVYIDAWETDDDNEEGKVIALINIKTKEVGYAVNSARYDDYAQEIINETLSNLGNVDCEEFL